jgi:hypothetical protein
MAIPIINFWKKYYQNPDEGLGSSYERIIIHERIMNIITKYNIKSLLEAPSFGFTGMSGINSMGFAKAGVDVTLIDHDEERLSLINQVWQEANIPLKSLYTNNYSSLKLADKSMDMAWNFSALWFTNDLTSFLTELDRITNKIIVLAVPNRCGLGYLSQKYLGKEDLNKYLIEDNIKHKNFNVIMKDLGWKQVYWDYFDCPPWPDIGMAKEDFLKKLKLDFLIKEKTNSVNNEILTVLDYWTDKKPNFAHDMMKYYWLEKYGPRFLKLFWAHHKFYVYKRKTR